MDKKQLYIAIAVVAILIIAYMLWPRGPACLTLSDANVVCKRRGGQTTYTSTAGTGGIQPLNSKNGGVWGSETSAPTSESDCITACNASAPPCAAYVYGTESDGATLRCGLYSSDALGGVVAVESTNSDNNYKLVVTGN